MRPEQTKGRLVCLMPERAVWLDGKRLDPRVSLKHRNHSPDGFSWGYGGSGPAQLALAILLELTDVEFALRHYQEFKWDTVARLEAGVTTGLPLEHIMVWIERRKAIDEHKEELNEKGEGDAGAG